MILFEVVMGGTILTVAVLASVALIPSTNKLEHSLTEIEGAHLRLRGVWEDLYALDAAEGFARYNDFEDDDPEGVGTAPGSSFDVPGLTATNPDGMVGHIEFPPHWQDGGTGATMVLEDHSDPTLAMPRDLNGDGSVFGSVSAASLKIIPARITLDWVGPGGEKHLEAIIVLGPK